MKILITLNDQGGGVILWNYDEVSGALRAQTKHHEPIVVIEDDGGTNSAGIKSESRNNHGEWNMSNSSGIDGNGRWVCANDSGDAS